MILLQESIREILKEKYNFTEPVFIKRNDEYVIITTECGKPVMYIKFGDGLRNKLTQKERNIVLKALEDALDSNIDVLKEAYKLAKELDELEDEREFCRELEEDFNVDIELSTCCRRIKAKTELKDSRDTHYEMITDNDTKELEKVKLSYEVGYEQHLQTLREVTEECRQKFIEYLNKKEELLNRYQELKQQLVKSCSLW